MGSFWTGIYHPAAVVDVLQTSLQHPQVLAKVLSVEQGQVRILREQRLEFCANRIHRQEFIASGALQVPYLNLIVK